jgi:predicted nuclease of restriction endonuclease-like (RecB) superfamily
MKENFDFQQLVDLCRLTHQSMQSHASRSVDAFLVVRNWLFGWYIVEFEKGGATRSELYGKKLINRLAERLKQEGVKGSSPTNLRKFREFYRSYAEIQQTPSVESFLPELDANMIRQTASVESLNKLIGDKNTQSVSPQLFTRFPLGWSHYVALLSIDNHDERGFYEIEAAANNWGVRELERQISSSLYERLALSRDKKEIRRLSQEGQVIEKAADIIKNPLVLEFLGFEEKPSYSEDELESAIIDKLEEFLLELGKGFLFEARQKRFTFDNDHFYVDLVFYNRLLRCYVLIDLKREKLTHQDLGQMQMYVNYFDRFVKTADELPTVGIVLCHRKSDALVELTLPQNANIFASKYQLYLPSKEELKARLELIEAELGGDETIGHKKTDAKATAEKLAVVQKKKIRALNKQLPNKLCQ